MPSRHPRFGTLPVGLFRGLARFRELEQRIAALPEELQRGDAFEVFVEAYLWLTTVWQVHELWLVGQVPLDLRRELNLPADAKGIDGVFCARSGVVVPYQVKHRIGRPVVGVAEVATFLGLTERATDRVLISNSDRYAADVENRDHLRVVRGMDFDALTVEDLQGIADWLDARPVTLPRRSPLPHQRRALADIAATLTTHDRATVVMACGTGKTLVGLWAAEQQSPSTVLVLVPSLALLSQALGDWSRDTSWDKRFEYLCVCSDPTVSAEQDEPEVRSTDVPFHVDTDPDVVRRFLKRPSKGTVRVVFSTYHSSPVVADGQRELAPFDLAIFDEAHKTTGAIGTTFALALDEKRLPIRKRLFFTATPRHIDIRHRDREGDFKVVSMDDPEIYGPRAHTLSFADAVAEGLICDYRVVVSVVDPVEVTAFAFRHGITMVTGDQQATRWVATLIAVTKAIQETGATKVITFHSRVSTARAFASDSPRGIRQHLNGFAVDHVNGAMRVSDRKAILSGFGDTERRLVTNARCLTEGVDLPAVDMVVFSDPRKSRIDIVQAIGRAMRKPRNGDKVCGYVVVPVFLAPHETDDVSAACAETEWEEIIDVLAALREHDARLDEIIRAAQVAKGRGEAFNPRAFAERVQVLGPLVSLDVLERHVGAVVLDRLGLTWDLRYGELVVFKEREGHCNVPKNYPALGTWWDAQRQSKRHGTLSTERITRLDALGVVWDPQETLWDSMFSALVAFKAQHGHYWVPEHDPENPRLSTWVNNQRTRKRSGELSQERIARLTEIGFPWDPFDSFWEEMFQSLVRFKAQHGHFRVSRRDPKWRQLLIWLQTQRAHKKLEKLSSEHADRLEKLGFLLQPRQTRWHQRVRELTEFKAAHGHCNVPADYRENPSLGNWLDQQRQARKRGTLSQERIAQLEALGALWEVPRDFWEQRFEDLKTFKAQHGHCNVPGEYPENEPLGTWLNNQKRLQRRGGLAPERIKRLETIGVVWNVFATRWDEMVRALVAFKKKYGHCKVPQTFPENRKLGTWLMNQRRFGSQGQLSSERITQLQALGVTWEPSKRKAHATKPPHDRPATQLRNNQG